MSAFINFGAPLNIKGIRYNDVTDRYDDQKKIIGDFQMDVQNYLLSYSEDNQIYASIVSEELMQQEFMLLIDKDTFFAVFSVLFVYFYLNIHLKSIFLATIGIVMILFSFPISAIIYQGVLGINYLNVLHNMTLFIILGIAADDIFVFHDAWR